MNCTRCGTPLEANARFCPNCGLTLPVSAPPPAQSYEPMVREDVPTVPIGPGQVPPLVQPQPYWQQAQFPPQPQVQAQSVPPYQPGQPVVAPTQPMMPGSMPSNVQASPKSLPMVERARPRRRRRGGCLRGFLITLLLLLVAAGLGWFLGLRPYLHTFAQSQIDLVLSNAVNQIPATAPALLPGNLAVRENAINNLIVLNSAPSDPVQHVHMTITPQVVRLDFVVYGFACDVTGVPVASNGNIIITNVNVEGIVALIMSPDEVTAVINKYLGDARARLQHTITGVTLKNHELDLTIGPLTL